MRLRLFLLVVLIISLVGCSQRKPTRASDIPLTLSHQYTIAVMPFTQPTSTSELIAGRIPQHQGLVPELQFSDLDVDLRDLLQEQRKQRPITFASLDSVQRHNPLAIHEGGRPQGLENWVRIGRKLGKQFILVPQVFDWHERQGSEAAVDQPAHVRLEMYLIRIDTGRIQSRTVYEEKQQGLADNLLQMKDFVRRKGAWVSARRLAKDGMAQMLKDMNL